MGKLIVFNGLTSSGKTTIAYDLHLFYEFYHVRADDFLNMRPSGNPEEISLYEEKALGYMQNMIDQMIYDGNNVILDHIFLKGYGSDCFAAYKQKYRDLTSVWIECPLHELARRERYRIDRQKGLSGKQYPLIDETIVYDIQVNSFFKNSLENAEMIFQAIR